MQIYACSNAASELSEISPCILRIVKCSPWISVLKLLPTTGSESLVRGLESMSASTKRTLYLDNLDCFTLKADFSWEIVKHKGRHLFESGAGVWKGRDCVWVWEESGPV